MCGRIDRIDDFWYATALYLNHVSRNHVSGECVLGVIHNLLQTDMSRVSLKSELGHNSGGYSDILDPLGLRLLGSLVSNG